jgi:hypothetical protein
MLALPSSKAKLKAEMGKTRSQLRQKVHPASYPDGINLTVVKTLPTEGKSREWLEEEWKSMKRLQGDDVGSGRVSGTVYHVSMTCGSSMAVATDAPDHGPVYREARSSTKSSTPP